MKNEQLVRVVKIFMLLGGLWKNPFSQNPLLRKCYPVYSVFMRVNFLVFWTLLVMELVRVISAGAGTVIYLNLAILINASRIASKIIIYEKNGIPELFKLVINEEGKILKDKDEEIFDEYSKLVKYGNTLMICQFLFTTSATVSFFIAGVVTHVNDEAINKLTNQTLETPFLYQVWFPHKRDHIGSVYALNAWFACLCMIYNSVTHMIFINLLVFMATQFRMLQIRLKKLDSVARDFHGGDVALSIKKFVVDHVKLLRFAETLNNSTKYVMLMEFLLSSMDCASVATQAITLESASKAFYLTFYFQLLVWQIFVLGWSANEIKMQCTAISDALYDTKWDLFDKEVRQILLIMMMRSQRPATMTIGPFSAMTNETALMIIKAAYSYVTVMKD